MKTLRGRRNFGQTLFLGFTLLSVLFVSLTVSSFLSISNTTTAVQKTTRNNDIQLNAAMAMRVSVRERALIVSHMYAEPDPFERDRLYEEFLEHGSGFLQAREHYLASQLTPKERQLLATLDEETSKRANTLRLYANSLHSGDTSELQVDRLNEVISDQTSVANTLDQIIRLQRNQANELERDTQTHIERTLSYLIGAMLLAILIGVAFARFVIRAANEYILELHTTTEELSASKAALESANEQLERLARIDHLTGLPNRLSLSEHYSNRLAWARRHGRRGALLFIDLDDFKKINDQFGHDAGDEFLRLIAAGITEAVRDTDTTARLGGDEFIVLLNELSDDRDAVIVVEKILAVLNAPYTVENQTLKGSGSIGICYFPSESNNLEDVIKRADDAMYEAKSRGKNGYLLCDETAEEKQWAGSYPQGISRTGIS